MCMCHGCQEFWCVCVSEFVLYIYFYIHIYFRLLNWSEYERRMCVLLIEPGVVYI